LRSTVGFKRVFWKSHRQAEKNLIRDDNKRRIMMKYAFLTLLATLIPAAASAELLGTPQAVPGPVAGAGLAYLVITGGYVLYRRWKR